MKILVTGGAGYVGSIVVEELIREGFEVVVLDNLQEGHRSAILPEAEFVKADINDIKAVDHVFQRFDIQAVMHLAADSLVELSMTDPKRYFQNNVVAGINLLNSMLKHDVKSFIYSSSAAVYGEPISLPIDETHPQMPLNPYGETKLMFERILKWYGKAYSIKHVSLRYFNAAGASERLGEDHRPETHLIPRVIKAAMNNANPVIIFGDDYATRDGTCIRDYVHVIDIAQAHILALKKINELGDRAYNLGSSNGYSVLEVVQEVFKVSGLNVPIKYSQRRPGDPAILVASSSRAKSDLKWDPKFSNLDIIVESAWKWISKHPNGYND